MWKGIRGFSLYELLLTLLIAALLTTIGLPAFSGTLARQRQRAEVDALGPTQVLETSYPGVWLVTHRNAEDSIVARFIEVTDTPELLKSQPADIEYAIQKLETELTN